MKIPTTKLSISIIAATLLVLFTTITCAVNDDVDRNDGGKTQLTYYDKVVTTPSGNKITVSGYKYNQSPNTPAAEITKAPSLHKLTEEYPL